MLKVVWTVAWLTFWAYLGLKLSGAWAINWWTVTSPLWIASVFTGVLVVVIGFLAAVVGYKSVKQTETYQQARNTAYEAVRRSKSAL